MCRDDTKLSHLASTDLFHPLTGTRHVTFLRLCCCLCFVLGVFWFALVCFLVFFSFAFCSLGCCFCSHSDKGFGLCIGPLPVAFAANTASALRELIN